MVWSYQIWFIWKELQMFQDKFCVPANHFPGGSPGNDDKSGGGGGEQQITHLFFFFVPRLGKTTSVLIFFFFLKEKQCLVQRGQHCSTAASWQTSKKKDVPAGRIHPSTGDKSEPQTREGNYWEKSYEFETAEKKAVLHGNKTIKSVRFEIPSQKTHRICHNLNVKSWDQRFKRCFNAEDTE